MKSSFWIILFFISLACQLISIQFDIELLQFISKPLIGISLLGYVAVSYLNSFNKSHEHLVLKRPVIAALLFSLAGDVLLMFQDKDPNFFLMGLVAFLIAHIFYIRFFYLLRKKEKLRFRILIILPVLAYYILLLTILWKYLAEMKMPVVVYGFVISMMLFFALHMFYISRRVAGRSMALGAVLFVMSDSLLAFNKFYQQFAYAGLLIILSYGLAQYFIVSGAVNYIKQKD